MFITTVRGMFGLFVYFTGYQSYKREFQDTIYGECVFSLIDEIAQVSNSTVKIFTFYN